MNDVDGLISHTQLCTINYRTPGGEVTCVAPPTVLTGEVPCFGAIPGADLHGEAIRQSSVASSLKAQTTRRPPRPHTKSR